MRLRWSAEARRQFIEARRYIELDNRQAALTASRAILTAAERLTAYPESGRMDPLIGARICVVPRTRYSLHYEIAGDIVRILAVWHGAREWPAR